MKLFSRNRPKQNKELDLFIIFSMEMAYYSDSKLHIEGFHSSIMKLRPNEFRGMVMMNLVEFLDDLTNPKLKERIGHMFLNIEMYIEKYHQNKRLIDIVS